MFLCVVFLFFFFKQKTAYEMRISDWSSDVCSSDLRAHYPWASRAAGSLRPGQCTRAALTHDQPREQSDRPGEQRQDEQGELDDAAETLLIGVARDPHSGEQVEGEIVNPANQHAALGREQRHHPGEAGEIHRRLRSEEHTSELQSLMRNSYAV